MGLIRRNAGSLVAVDIGAAAVKVVQLARQTGGGSRLAACALEPLPPNAVSGGHVSEPGVVGEAIGRALARAKCKARRAVAAVPAAAVATRTIAVDAALTDSEIEVEVALEAQAQLPFGDQELALDFEVLQLSAADPARLDVAVTACRRDAVRQREAALRAAGLRTVAVDVESAGLQRLAARQCPAETVAVADLGGSGVKLLVLRDDAALFSRSEPFAGGALQGPGAETAKSAVLQLLARQLHMAAAASSPPVRLLLAGGGAGAPGLAAEAEQALGIAASVLQPVAGMDVAPAVERTLLADGAPAMATACGLALRGLAEGAGDRPEGALDAQPMAFAGQEAA